MIPTPIATAQIELRLGGESPDGVLTGADGRARRFSGWIELAAAIEDWRTTAPGASTAAALRTTPKEEPR